LLDDGIRRITGVSIDPIAWAQAPSKPTPTIIEAARALYAQHSVDEISRSDAGARNLALTSRRIEALIDEARAVKVKISAFVTGVPGAERRWSG
jgi:aminoglycoside phosphotransferase (APT) family kinase protein